MKNFVLNFFSKDKSKFYTDGEVLNLILTALAFEQNVTLIINNEKEISKKESLKFLSAIWEISEEFRVVFNQEKLIGKADINKKVELVTNNEIKELINKADYFVNC